MNAKAIVSEGANKPALSFNYTPIVKNEDGSYTGEMEIVSTLPDLTELTVTGVVCCNYERYNNGDGEYDEAEVAFEVEVLSQSTQKVTFTVPAELAADYATGSGTVENPSGLTGFDFYYDMVFDGAVSANQYYSVSSDYFTVE